MQVKLARRISTGELCALKIIEHKATFSHRQQELFRREIQAMSNLHDPNVVSLRRIVTAADFPHEDGRPRTVCLLELEICGGGELFEYVLRGGAFPESAAKFLFRQILSALRNCHAQGIFHRDLKPGEM